MAQGFEKMERIDYEETFASVLKWPPIKATILIAPQKD